MLPNWLYGKSKSKLAELLGGGGGTPSDYNQVKAQVTQNAEDIIALSDALDGKAALTQITNPNLLDNPWFTVNQRGSTSYTLAQRKYGFDRWYAHSGGEIISKSDDTISLNGSTTNQYSGLAQRVERDRLKVGETYTLSILFSDGEVESKTFTLTSSASNFFGSWNHAPKFVAVITSPSSNTWWEIFPFDAMANLDATVSFKAIKLELGSVSTLAMDTAPDMALELAKCQRYFQNIVNTDASNNRLIGIAYAVSAASTRMLVTLPDHMRTDAPAFSKSGDFVLQPIAGGTAIDVTSVSSLGLMETYINIRADVASGLTAGSTYFFQAKPNAALDFSADL